MGWEIMDDDRLHYIIDNWHELNWITRLRIDWLRFLAVHRGNILVRLIYSTN